MIPDVSTSSSKKNIFNKCRKSSSSFVVFLIGCLLLLQFPQSTTQQKPAPVPPTKWHWEKPIGSIEGSYLMKLTKVSEHPPTLATLWELKSSDFSVVVWPPKYCQAVHVFFIKSTYKGIGHFHAMDDMPTSPSIKFYPAIGRIDVSTDGTTSTSYFNQRSSVPFTHVGSSKFTLEVAKTYVDKIKKYNVLSEDTSNMETISLELSNRVALVLTSSRMCFAHLTRDGSHSEYFQLFNPMNYDLTSPALPKAFTTFLDPKGLNPSLFDPLTLRTPGSKKSVDLLPVLKDPQFLDQSQMRRPPMCKGFVTVSRDPLQKSRDMITVDSWVVQDTGNSINERDEHIMIHIGDTCSWIRLWITDQNNKMDQYPSLLKLEETIDIFFDQQFFVGPDSDEARPLSGNSSQIGKISIRRHKPEKGAAGLTQLSYGRDAGPDLPYIEFFHMSSFSQPNMRVHLIRAPRCEANILTVSNNRLSSASFAPANIFQFSNCDHHILTNKNNDPVSVK